MQGDAIPTGHIIHDVNGCSAAEGIEDKDSIPVERAYIHCSEAPDLLMRADLYLLSHPIPTPVAFPSRYILRFNRWIINVTDYCPAIGRLIPWTPAVRWTHLLTSLSTIIMDKDNDTIATIR